MRRTCVALAMVVVLPALGTTSAGAVAASGLRGLVTRSPTTPVCMVDVPCSAPARNTTLVFSRAGRSVPALTNDEGRYRVALAPGVWSVRTAQVPHIGSGVRPRSVRVLAARFRVVEFAIDTGIR